MKVKSKNRWIFVIVVSAFADVVIRFGKRFDYSAVKIGEAILLLGCAVVFSLLMRFDGAVDVWPRWIRLSLVWFYALGGIRCALWIIGFPLYLANFGTLGLALIVVVFYAVIRRRSGLGVRSER